SAPAADRPECLPLIQRHGDQHSRCPSSALCIGHPRRARLPCGPGRCVMLDNSVLAAEVLRHGAYVCLRLSAGADARAAAGVAIPALAEKLGLQNEFAPAAGPPTQSIALLRRQTATPGPASDHSSPRAHTAVPAHPP